MSRKLVVALALSSIALFLLLALFISINKESPVLTVTLPYELTNISTSFKIENVTFLLPFLSNRYSHAQVTVHSNLTLPCNIFVWLYSGSLRIAEGQTIQVIEAYSTETLRIALIWIVKDSNVKHISQVNILIR